MSAGSRKKILYIEQNTDGTVGGSYFSLLYLVEGLDKSRFEPTVAFYRDHHLVPAYKQAGCAVMLLEKPRALDFSGHPAFTRFKGNAVARAFFVAPALLIQKSLNYFRTFVFPVFACWSMLRAGGFDLVHLNNTVLRPQQWIVAAMLSGVKAVAHERGINNRFPALAFFVARFLSSIICISGAVKGNLESKGFPASKLSLIYNGLDPERFRPSRPAEEVRRELGLGKDSPLIGIVGNIKAWKGQEVVIRAMRIVRERFPNAICLIIGDSSPSDAAYRSSVERLIESEGLRDAIKVTGFRKDVPDLVNCLDALVHASVEPEPFGRVLLEGMALEKPVISNTIGSGPEIVDDGATGFLVPPADPAQLAGAIIKVFEDPGRAKEMGKAGLKRLHKLFHVSYNIKKTEELYNRILWR